MMRPIEAVNAALLRFLRDVLRGTDEGQGAPSTALETPFSTTTQSDWAEAVRLWNANGRHRIASLPERDCPACGGRDRRGLFESYDGYPFVECGACGCWYVPMVVEADMFERFFADCPEAYEVARRSLAKRSSPENAKADEERIGSNIDALLPLLPEGAARRYLDVGCGVGVSLRVAASRGMVATGTESSADCIEIGRREGLDIRPASAMPQAGPFDLVSFWESLEHLADPCAVLRSVRDVMSVGGLLAFTVPNQLSPLVRAQREDCAFVNGGFDTAGHINLFSPATLERLMDRSGLALVDIDGQYGLSLPELASYLAGRNRGASDLLSGKPVDSRLPGVAAEFLDSVGPAFSKMERIALMTPIVFGVACRKESVETLRERVAVHKSRRRASLLEEVEAMIPEPREIEGYQQRLRALEEELAETHRRLELSDNENLQIRRALKALRDPLGTLARFLGKK